MTDRICALIVVLEQDTRDDDVQHWENAIRMMRGVARVDRIPAEGFNGSVERMRLLPVLQERLLRALHEELET